MRFEEIFKEKGLYKASSFSEGVAFEVNENFELHTVCYTDKDDLLPEKHPTLVYADLFNKEYNRVFTRQSLFEKK